MIKGKKKNVSLYTRPQVFKALREECAALFVDDEISRLPSFKTR